MLRNLLPVFFLLLLLNICSAQENWHYESEKADSARSDSVSEAFTDTLGELETRLLLDETYAETPRDSIKTQNPTVALFKSMLIPGLGQIGNKSYLKAGLAIALESVFIAAIVHWADKTNKAWDRFQIEPDTSDSRGDLYRTYSNYKDKRNFYSWMLGTTIFISMFDAYVDAHLRKFPKFRNDEEGLSLEFGPTAPDRYDIRLSWNF